MFQLNQTQLAQMSLIGQISGMFSSAAGSYFSADLQKSNLRFQADMAEISARISEQSAQSALLQGQQQIGALTLKAGQLKGRQRASLAANGVDLGVGSAAEIQASSDIMKEIDMNTLEANSIRAAWGYRMQSMNAQNDALMRRATASAISPMGSMVSSLIGGATSVAGSWYQMNKAGMFNGSTQWGTNPGSQQTQMLAAQESGFGGWRF